MPSFNDFYFSSSNGRNRIRARVCTPDVEPRAVIQIAHGIAEHIERYDDFMTFLGENGFVVVGNDHLGHGKSYETDEDKGFFAEENGWACVVKDMDRLRTEMRKRYPDLPYVFFGHSMGSFLTRTYLIDHPDSYDAAIISGTGHMGLPIVLGGLGIANLLVKLNGAHGDGTALNNIAFGAYCDKIDDPRTPYDWLSRDAAQVDKYIADPNCGFICKISLYRDMMAGIKYITSRKNIEKMNKERPIYFMSGSADPVGEYGAGVERAYNAFCHAGQRDVMIRLYPDGRHEMLNELNRADVYRDILNWLNEKLA